MTESKPLVVVLGASGMLGTAVTRHLATRDIRLRVAGRRPSTVPTGGSAEVEVVQADLTTPGALANVLDGADAVIHLVAHIDGPATWRVAEGDHHAERVNVGLLRDLVEAIAAQRREKPPVVVFAGSMSQVGRAARARVDGSEIDEPMAEYDRHKLAAEQTLKAATKDGIVRGISLRLATLFSHGTDPGVTDKGVVATMIRRALAGQPLTMWHDGTVQRDLISVDDAALAFVSALDHADALSGGHWLVGTGQATSIGELFTMIAKVVSSATGNPPAPVVSVEPAEYSSQTDLLNFVTDPSAFQRASGWAPRQVLLDALQDAVTAEQERLTRK